MFKLPLIIVYMIIAFNLTVFSLFLQLDMLIFHALIYKILAWFVTIGAWTLAYRNRNKFVTIG